MKTKILRNFQIWISVPLTFDKFSSAVFGSVLICSGLSLLYLIIGPKLLTEEYASSITEILSTQLIDKIECIIKRMCYKATLFPE